MFETVFLKGSSCFKRISYNKEEQRLYVTFRATGKTYCYQASPKIFVDFVQSESKGKFYNMYIKPLPFNLVMS